MANVLRHLFLLIQYGEERKGECESAKRFWAKSIDLQIFLR